MLHLRYPENMQIWNVCAKDKNKVEELIACFTLTAVEIKSERVEYP